jgi:hypothetical protein
MENTIRPLRFWLPLDAYRQQEIIVPAQYVDSIMLRAAEHEVGHAIVAHHYQARVFGIGVRMPARGQNGMTLFALYGSNGWSIETQCVVKAAGAAADVLYHGGFDDESASGDLRDIESLTGIAALEPYLSTAKQLLSGYADKLERTVTALRNAIVGPQQRTFEILPDNRVGTYFLNERELLALFEVS